MSFTYPRESRSINETVFVSDCRLWLTQDRSRVVPEGHPEARFLFAVPGRKIAITMKEAMRLGLMKVKESAPAETKVIYPAGTKQSKKKAK